MKKQLLLATGLLTSGLLCAQLSKKAVDSKIPARILKYTSESKSVKEYMPTGYSNVSMANPKPIVTPNNANKTSNTNAQTEVIIGTTLYDLQTNNSVADRIVTNADGSTAAVWTMEPSDAGTTYPNRGTGYAYNNGSSWTVLNPSARIENVRVGWGNIVNTRSGIEFVISHGANTAGKMNKASRPVKGTGTWTNDINAIATATTYGNFWPRAITKGDTVYTISITYPTTPGPGVLFQGLDGALVFSRSTNGGATWDIVNTIPTGYTSADYRGFSGDGYAIAAKGNTVAIVAGEMDRDVVLSKSIDGGVTWTATRIYDCPIVKWDHTTKNSDYNNDGTADTLETNDGCFTIGLDNSGEAYVFFGRTRILQAAVATSQTWSVFTGTDGLYMWKESYGASTFPNQTAVIVAAIEDLYEQGTIYFDPPAVSGKPSFGQFGCSLTSFPSVAFDDNNTMYLLYSSIVDSLESIASPTKNVRHEYVIKSCDGGANWTDPYDIFIDPLDFCYERVYGSLAKRVDGKLHIIYQRDFYAGYGINATDDADNQGQSNDIIYVEMPVTDLPNCPIPTGIKTQTATDIDLNFYPNPASSSGTIEVSLKESAKMDIVILNNVGQTVYSTSSLGHAGFNKVEVDLSNLASGLYFYQVKIGDKKAITKKFAVGK